MSLIPYKSFSPLCSLLNVRLNNYYKSISTYFTAYARFIIPIPKVWALLQICNYNYHRSGLCQIQDLLYCLYSVKDILFIKKCFYIITTSGIQINIIIITLKK